MFAEVNGVRLCYEVFGDGEPVVLIAGFGANRKFWGNMVPLLDGFKCITLDNRGVGDTEYEGDFSVDDMADDIIALMDHLGIGRFSALGWSMGSLILQSMSLRYPDRIASQVMVSTHRDRPARSSYVLGEFTRMVNEGTCSMEGFYVMVNTLCLSEGVFRSFEDRGRNVPVPRRNERPEGIRDQLKAIVEFYPGERLSDIKVPTLVVQGTEDIMTPFELGRTVCDMIDGAELYPVEGQGHNIMSELYAQKVSSFFRSHLG